MDQNTKIRAGVMGWPVGHSLSPRLHGFWLKQYGINGSYEAIAVAPDNFAQHLQKLAADGYAGVNITVPHKEAALEQVDQADDIARRIGAVNTIVVRADGKLQGTNTDAFGFLENLKDGNPHFDFSDGPAIILGAGGAARAVVVALIDAGVPEIRLANRTLERAEILATQLGGPIRVVPWQDRGEALADAGLLVNTTTLGMQNQPTLEIDLQSLPREALVTDIVYAPLETELLKAAQQRGNITTDGLGMLLHQARPGFEAWFGVKPEVSPALREAVLAGMKG